MPRIASFIVACLCGFACLAAAQEAGLIPILGKQALRDAAADRTIYWEDGGMEFHDPSGRSGYFDASENCLKRGEWWIARDEICYRYPDVRQGPFCFRWFYIGDTLVQFHESYGVRPSLDNVERSISVKPGNPSHLDINITTCGLS